MSNNTKKSFLIKIVLAAIVLVLVLIAAIATGENLGKNTGGSENEEITVDPSKLAETKEEGFDIMEYDEYLNLNRSVIYYEKDTGASYSIDDTNYWGFGADIKLVYELIEALIAGDSDAYNSLVHEDAGHFESFTQQQIYDIYITRNEISNIENGDVTYTEYVVMVEYKIHENNGSFRKDIESDASRPQYLVIDNSSGKLLVTDIVSVKYAN